MSRMTNKELQARWDRLIRVLQFSSEIEDVVPPAPGFAKRLLETSRAALDDPPNGKWHSLDCSTRKKPRSRKCDCGLKDS